MNTGLRSHGNSPRPNSARLPGTCLRGSAKPKIRRLLNMMQSCVFPNAPRSKSRQPQCPVHFLPEPARASGAWRRIVEAPKQTLLRRHLYNGRSKCSAVAGLGQSRRRLFDRCSLLPFLPCLFYCRFWKTRGYNNSKINVRKEKIFANAILTVPKNIIFAAFTHARLGCQT